MKPSIRQQQDRPRELNVTGQVTNLCQTTIVQDAWERGQEVTVHGWVYGLHDGLLLDLGMTVNSAESLAEKLGTVFARYEL